MAKKAKKRDRAAERKRRDHRRGRGLSRPKFPAHLAVNAEEWRAKKRTEWRDVIQALSRYGWGAAYTPSNAALFHLQRLAEQVTDAIDAPNWIAWK